MPQVDAIKQAWKNAKFFCNLLRATGQYKGDLAAVRSYLADHKDSAEVIGNYALEFDHDNWHPDQSKTQLDDDEYRTTFEEISEVYNNNPDLQEEVKKFYGPKRMRSSGKRSRRSSGRPRSRRSSGRPRTDNLASNDVESHYIPPISPADTAILYAIKEIEDKFGRDATRQAFNFLQQLRS